MCFNVITELAPVVNSFFTQAPGVMVRFVFLCPFDNSLGFNGLSRENFNVGQPKSFLDFRQFTRRNTSYSGFFAYPTRSVRHGAKGTRFSLGRRLLTLGLSGAKRIPLRICLMARLSDLTCNLERALYIMLRELVESTWFRKKKELRFMPDQGTNPAFSGSSKYVLDEELAKIVNISIALEMPLLLKGEPGTGKTMLAHSIAETLGMPLIVLNVKSSLKLVEALYQYDTLTRLNDSRFGDSSRDVSNIQDYIRMGKIGRAFVADTKTVLLIDEIDKADTDFQDDMLDVLDQMEFDIIEIDKTISARLRPVIIITSNAKKDLSDPFLGRCNFHHIAFPEPDMMRQIVRVHFSDLDNELLEICVKTFYGLRELQGIEKKPATRELINWIRALRQDHDFRPKDMVQGKIPFLGILFKKSPDYQQAVQQIRRRRS